MRRTEFLEVMQNYVLIEYICIFVQFLNDEVVNACLDEL